MLDSLLNTEKGQGYIYFVQLKICDSVILVRWPLLATYSHPESAGLSKHHTEVEEFIPMS